MSLQTSTPIGNFEYAKVVQHSAARHRANVSNLISLDDFQPTVLWRGNQLIERLTLDVSVTHYQWRTCTRHKFSCGRKESRAYSYRKGQRVFPFYQKEIDFSSPVSWTQKLHFYSNAFQQCHRIIQNCAALINNLFYVFIAVKANLQWTVIGPSSPNCSCVFCTCSIKSIRFTAAFWHVRSSNTLFL